MIKALVAWGPAAIWAAVLFLLSEMSPGSGGMWGVVNDKVAHLGLYTILGVALAWGARRNGNRPAPAILVLVGVAYGVLDEWHQSFVPGRTPDGGDLIADAAGVVLGLLAFRLLISRHVSGHPNLRSDSERRDP